MDGTLVDSLSDIGNAMNVVLASYGFPQHAIETYKTLVGEVIAKRRYAPCQIR